jgi:hypothetical protein
MRNTADVTGGKPIAVLLQSISDVSATNPLVAFYDIHGGKREVLFFYLYCIYGPLLVLLGVLYLHVQYRYNIQFTCVGVIMMSIGTSWGPNSSAGSVSNTYKQIETMLPSLNKYQCFSRHLFFLYPPTRTGPAWWLWPVLFMCNS